MFSRCFANNIPIGINEYLPTQNVRTFRVYEKVLVSILSKHNFLIYPHTWRYHPAQFGYRGCPLILSYTPNVFHTNPFFSIGIAGNG